MRWQCPRTAVRSTACAAIFATDLYAAFADSLDSDDALTATSAVIDALVAVALHGVQHGESGEQFRAAMHRAIDLLGRGLGA